MATHTRFVAQLVIQEVTTTDTTQTGTGFGSSSQPKVTERARTLLSSGFDDADLSGVVTKAKYALALAYPTVTQEAASASPSS